MAEWSIAAVLKTVELRGSGGSNPSLSARPQSKKVSISRYLLFFIPKHKFTCWLRYRKQKIRLAAFCEEVFVNQHKSKKEMKKILMLVIAFVIGNGVLDMLPTVSAQEVSTHSNPQDTTTVAASRNMAAFIESIKADPTYLHNCVDSLINEKNRVATRGADSLSAASDKVFESKVVKWAGRNRYGKFTDQCAAHANGCLARAGYYSQGHAYQIPSYFPSVINGYNNVNIPDLSKVSAAERFNTVLNMHHEAADYVKEHLDISKLVSGKYYIVNMYYSTSPYMLEFFYDAKKEGTGNYGTHVGVLYYNTEYETWVVEHNIHGHVYYDALDSILGGASNPHKYGVTSISRVSK